MINKATLVGRIGKKDTKSLNSGVKLTTLSIATNRKYIDSQGMHQEITTWHNVNFFNKVAEVAEKYAHVGDLIYIEGEISNKKVEDSNGVSKWIYSITGKELKLLPNGKKENIESKPNQEPESPISEDYFDNSEVPF
ncbi:MAG TPA: single-stranded DNA-binding protein [Flavitalea sp.]|nr:single-stranded DNA-binding protein [Flavitalea sp.]